MENILAGLQELMHPAVLLALVLGVGGGIAIGSLPGLTATMGVALLLPFTYGMSPVMGLVLLTSIYIGAIYGGSISAITIKTPGTPAAAATILDGFEMAQKGEVGRALSMSTIASFTGGIISVFMLITISPVLAKISLYFSAPEYFALSIFGLSIIAGISGKSPLKGLISGFIGLFVASVGLDPVTSFPRFTFNSIQLMSGFNLIPVLIGLFAVSEAFISMEKILAKTEAIAIKVKSQLISLKELIQVAPTMIRSALIGTFIGIIPGAGADIAAFVAYNEGKRFSKQPEKYGTGILEGVAAPEAGNNGVTGGALVPLLTLGIPGDAVAAILLGALIIQGLQPGPMLFTDKAPVVYAMFLGMILANFVMLGMGLLGVRLFTKVTLVPKNILIPIILSLCAVGSYAMQNNIMDVVIMLAFGIFGYFLQKLEIPLSPMVLAIILGPMAEINLRRSLLMFEGNLSFLWTRPIVVAFLAIGLLTFIGAFVRYYRDINSHQEETTAGE